MLNPRPGKKSPAAGKIKAPGRPVKKAAASGKPAVLDKIASLELNETNSCQENTDIIQEMKHFVRWMAKDGAVLDYFAGDLDKVPRELWPTFEQLRQSKGSDLFVDLLQALTHTRYSPERAKQLWEEILVHKYYMSQKMGRNAGIKVAVLDYLDNHVGLIKNFHLLPEKNLDCLLLFVNEDGLTGLYNHRYFQETLREELVRCQRYNRVFSLLFTDLDHFKSYNDQYGHMQGDMLLREISTFLKTASREVDTVARYGGDEFAIIMPETNRNDAMIFAKRLQQDFNRQKFGQKLAGPDYFSTLSMGVASFPSHARFAEELVEAADKALYTAKRSGRNCIRLATPLKAVNNRSL